MSDQTNKLLNIVNQSTDLVVFQPDAPQRRAKSTFWSYFTSDNTILPDSIDLPMALKFGADKRISMWWSSTDFQDWFCNRDEFRQRLEFLSHLALDAAEEILSSKTAPPQAKVNMAKLVIEAANKMPNRYAKSEDQFLDKKVSEMDKKQLEEFINRNLKLLPNVTPTNIDTDIE